MLREREEVDRVRQENAKLLVSLVQNVFPYLARDAPPTATENGEGEQNVPDNEHSEIESEFESAALSHENFSHSRVAAILSFQLHVMALEPLELLPGNGVHARLLGIGRDELGVVENLTKLVEKETNLSGLSPPLDSYSAATIATSIGGSNNLVVHGVVSRPPTMSPSQYENTKESSRVESSRPTLLPLLPCRLNA